MKLLAIEFSSAQRSVAVVQAGGRCPAPGHGLALAEVVARDERSASSHRPTTTTPTLELLDRALREAKLEREQIECLAIGLGPGSYAGIRAGIALAQGWQLGRDVKLLGVSSAECVAAQAQPAGIKGRVAVVIDAQRAEFYLAGYEIGATGRREVEPLRLAALSEVQACEKKGALLLGPEVTTWFPGGRLLFPRAATLGQLALERSDFVSGEKLEPIYLRETAFVKAPAPRSPQVTIR